MLSFAQAMGDHVSALYYCEKMFVSQPLAYFRFYESDQPLSVGISVQPHLLLVGNSYLSLEEFQLLQPDLGSS